MKGLEAGKEKRSFNSNGSVLEAGSACAFGPAAGANHLAVNVFGFRMAGSEASNRFDTEVNLRNLRGVR